MKRVISVEKKHIDRGAVGDCDLCPVAQALTEHLPFAAQVQVGDDFALIYDEDLQVIAECELPEIVRRFVSDFDNEFKVEPFSFELHVMKDFNRCRRCARITGITDELRCATCGELVCLVCGCTETRACVNYKTNWSCGWARPGICTSCVGLADSQSIPNIALVASMIAENETTRRTEN